MQIASRSFDPRIIVASLGATSLTLLWWASQGTMRADPREATELVRSIAPKPRNRPVTTPLVTPVSYLPFTVSEAVAFNAEQISADDVGPPAASFRLSGSSESYGRALKCLTDAVYYEAASEPLAGQRAVAQVVLNRVRNPAFPSSVCGVVYQGSNRITGCQFTFTCDGSLTRTVASRARSRALLIAQAALDGFVFEPVGYATHYHANWVVPYWAASLDRATSIGAHIFYRWKGAWGQPSGFKQRHPGSEPEPWPTRSLSYGSDLPIPVDAADPSASPIGPSNSSKSLAVDAHAEPVIAADRAIHRSSLRVDERPAKLIPSLLMKPEVIANDYSQSSEQAGRALSIRGARGTPRARQTVPGERN